MLRLLAERAAAYARRPPRAHATRAASCTSGPTSSPISTASLAAFAEAPDPELGPDQVKRAWRWCADRCPAVLDLDPGDRAERKAALADEPRRGDDEDGLGADAKAIGPDERATLDPEDDALLLRAYQLIRGELRKGKQPLVYEHLFVDEAQDLAPIDLAVPARRGREAQGPRRARCPLPSVTLAGDTAQRLHMDSGFRDWREVLDDLGLSGASTSSRCASPTARPARCSRSRATILGPLADPDAARRAAHRRARRAPPLPEPGRRRRLPRRRHPPADRARAARDGRDPRAPPRAGRRLLRGAPHGRDPAPAPRSGTTSSPSARASR